MANNDKGHGWRVFKGSNPPEMITVEVFGISVEGYRDSKGEFHADGHQLAEEVLGYDKPSKCLDNVSEDSKKNFSDLVLDDINYVLDGVGGESPPQQSLFPSLELKNAVSDRIDRGGYLNIKKERIRDKNRLGGRISFLTEYGIDGSRTMFDEVGIYEAILNGETPECKAVKRSLAEMLKKMRKAEFLKTLPDESRKIAEIVKVVRNHDSGAGNGDNDNQLYIDYIEDLDDASNIKDMVIINRGDSGDES